MPYDVTRYEIELLCEYSGWWRFNVFIMAVGYDRKGNRVCYNNYVDKVYDVEYGVEHRSAPADYKMDREIKLLTDPCSYVDIYVYAVTNTFPESENIKDSPPFTALLRISADGKMLDETEYEVNQWGGLTVVAHRADVEA